MKQKRVFSLLLALLICLPLPFLAACATGGADAGAEQFVFQLRTPSGEAAGGAQIALYSFLNEKVVATGRADTFGRATLHYSPSLPDSLRAWCGDYLVLVTKEGYAPRLHLMTKLYPGEDGAVLGAAREINSETQTIVLTPAEEARLPAPSEEEQRISDYCREEGKLSASSPIYVLREEDVAALREEGALPPTRTTSCEYYYNQTIPLGEFHTNAHCSVQVSFASSDVVRVEAAQKYGSSFLISGSVSRTMGNSTTFPAFTTSDSCGVKRVYSTQGTFVKKTVSYLSQGETYTTVTVQLDEITGGTIVGSDVRCGSCMKASPAVLGGQHGTYVYLVSGARQTQYAGTTVDFGLKASISQLSLQLGTSLSTSANAAVTYTARGGNICLYDSDHSGTLFHVTDA